MITGQNPAVSIQSNGNGVLMSATKSDTMKTLGAAIRYQRKALRLTQLRGNVDHVEPSNLQPEEVVDLPTIAMVSGLRKFTS